MVFMKMTILSSWLPAAFGLLPLPALVAGSFSPQKRQTPDLRINLLKRHTPKFKNQPIAILSIHIFISWSMLLYADSCLLIGQIAKKQWKLWQHLSPAYMSPGLPYSQNHIVYSNHHIIKIWGSHIMMIILSPAREPRLAIFSGWRQTRWVPCSPSTVFVAEYLFT